MLNVLRHHWFVPIDISNVPHGGMIVAAATNKPLLYTLDMAIGVIVTALLLMILKPNLEDKEKKKVGKAADQGSMPVK